MELPHRSRYADRATLATGPLVREGLRDNLQCITFGFEGNCIGLIFCNHHNRHPKEAILRQHGQGETRWRLLP